MTDALERVLRDLRADAEPEAASAFLRLATDYVATAAAGIGPVSSGVSIDDAAPRFDEALPTGGVALDALLKRLARDVLADGIRLQHPRYAGHQVSPPLPAAAWTDALIGATNQSIAVREMSPVLTLIEHRVVRWLCDLAGLPAAAGGTLTSGGTEATFTALLAARNAAIPDAWQDGVGAGGVIVCGEHAHYAVLRAAGELGLGSRSVVLIPSRDFRMDMDALASTLQRLAAQRSRIVAVVATAGSTPTGSFDDLETAVSLCREHGVWLHVDGAHGASALFSDAHRSRLQGIEHADSIAWDPHKMMLLPLSAGMLLVRDEAALERAFAQRAPYLFHAQQGRVVDQGIRSFQCSRRGDALKLWVALQRYGADGIAALYDHLCATTRVFCDAVRDTPGLEALHEPECNILCFRCVVAGRTEDELDALNWQVREELNRSGAAWITTTVLDGRRVLRVTIMNPLTTADDARAIVDAVAGIATRARAGRGGG